MYKLDHLEHDQQNFISVTLNSLQEQHGEALEAIDHQLALNKGHNMRFEHWHEAQLASSCPSLGRRGPSWMTTVPSEALPMARWVRVARETHPLASSAIDLRVEDPAGGWW